MDYIKEANRTKSDQWNCPHSDLVHGIVGINTEAGELMDHLKKVIFYGKSVDPVNIKEELGDLFWYVALICGLYGWTFEEIQKLNIDKLKERYADKFTTKEAENRDLDAEREVLETKPCKQVEVIVRGPAMSGKSTVTAIIANALSNHEVNFDVEDDDGMQHLLMRLHKSKDVIKHLSTKVTIRQEQTCRVSVKG